MARLNHVKIVTPQPEVVDAFLREVCEIPDGWPLGDAVPLEGDEPLGPGGELPRAVVAERRRAAEPARGFITGSTESRQFQVFAGEPAAVWAICISTRFVEDVHARAVARRVQCTPIEVADWNEHDNIRFFFCQVAGLMFEVMRVEPKVGA